MRFYHHAAAKTVYEVEDPRVYSFHTKDTPPRWDGCRIRCLVREISAARGIVLLPNERLYGARDSEGQALGLFETFALASIRKHPEISREEFSSFEARYLEEGTTRHADKKPRAKR